MIISLGCPLHLNVTPWKRWKNLQKEWDWNRYDLTLWSTPVYFPKILQVHTYQFGIWYSSDPATNSETIINPAFSWFLFQSDWFFIQDTNKNCEIRILNFRIGIWIQWARCHPNLKILHFFISFQHDMYAWDHIICKQNLIRTLAIWRDFFLYYRAMDQYSKYRCRCGYQFYPHCGNLASGCKQVEESCLRMPRKTGHSIYDGKVWK